jgi:hypothetical protein
MKTIADLGSCGGEWSASRLGHFTPGETATGTRRIGGKGIPVTAHEGPQRCETLRFPHFLDNRLTYGGKVVSPTLRPPFTPRNIPGTHFCQRLSRPQDHSAAGMIT